MKSAEACHGYAGSATRAKLNSLFGCVGPTAISPTPATPGQTATPSPVTTPPTAVPPSTTVPSTAVPPPSSNGQLLTVQTDPGTPTGGIEKGQGQVTLAMFDLTPGSQIASNDAVEMKYLTFKFTFTGGSITSTTTLNNAIKNYPPSGLTCDVNGASEVSGVQSTDVYLDCVGNAVNYFVRGHQASSQSKLISK